MRAALARQWKLIRLTALARRGVTIQQMMEQTGATRATAYRDIAQLRDGGVPFDQRTTNGEVRYSLMVDALPPLGPTVLQLAALQLARRALTGLEGAGPVAELDRLLSSYDLHGMPRASVSLAKPRAVAPNIVNKLDRAITSQRCTRIRHRSAAAQKAAWRTVDPLGLHHVKGHLYFVAHDHTRNAVRKFKLDRISTVDILPDKAASHPDFAIHTLFARSVKVWTGDEVDIVVQLSANVARIVHEYPLVQDQTVTDEQDGAVIVHARVAGLVEATRWVLSWGKDAEALEPRELREAVASEARGAAGRYGETRRNQLLKPQKPTEARGRSKRDEPPTATAEQGVSPDLGRP